MSAPELHQTGTPYRVGLFRHNQWRNDLEPDHHDLWPQILKAYRRYRKMGISRAQANLITIGYADGLRPGPVITHMRASDKDR